MVILESGEEIFVGFAISLYEFLFTVYEKAIVPFHGHTDYVLVKNIYNPILDEIVSYKALG